MVRQGKAHGVELVQHATGFYYRELSPLEETGNNVSLAKFWRFLTMTSSDAGSRKRERDEYLSLKLDSCGAASMRFLIVMGGR
ncbi:hypothetical protein V6N13_032133 [Hibiscus sabdariffa]